MPTIAVILWITNRQRFRVWMALVVSLAVVGVTTYFLFPMVPPWLASQGGALPGPKVGTYTLQGFDAVGLHLVGVAIYSGRYLSNPVAAMPSLHMAYATLAVGFFWWHRKWWQRLLLVMYPIAMGFSLVYAGEHYVIDEIAGVAYAVVIIAAWRLLRRRRLIAQARDSTAARAESRLLTASL
jgi:membrane-associated phospholipid phosphatase